MNMADDASTSAISRAVARRREIVEKFESRRKLRATTVPTNDAATRAELRRRGEPVTLFGEREGDRRERLRGILAALDAADGGELERDGADAEDDAMDADGAPERGRQRETFFTEGVKGLLECRVAMAEFSLPRAAKRVREERVRNADARGLAKTLDAIVASTSGFAAQCSEIGDDTRPIACARAFDDGRRAVTGSWSGEARVWKIDAPTGRMTSELVIRCTDHRITGVDAVANVIATAHADGTAAIWNANDGSRARELKGRHAARCGNIAFHPSGARYVATAGFDATWRLWNVETGDELLCQEGHAKEVYDVAFHPDGGLAASVGLDAVGRVWDLRIGRAIGNPLRGHVKQILSCDFHPNGTHIVTGSGDNTAKAWDLRRANECVYTMANHENLISQVRYAPNGAFLLSASYDGTVNAYDARDFSLNKKIVVCTGSGATKITCCDVAADDALIIGCFDRTVKLYTK